MPTASVVGAWEISVNTARENPSPWGACILVAGNRHGRILYGTFDNTVKIIEQGRGVVGQGDRLQFK